jgi:DNA-directed RNA polymerase subunit RPC12/RpoP
MKEHFCPAEQSTITYQGECSWCGEREALAQTKEPVAVYGYCPECGAKGVMRERRPNGNDKCANGHTYPSSTSTSPQRTWVGLTDEEVKDIVWNLPYEPSQEHIRAIEARLKELNT